MTLFQFSERGVPQALRYLEQVSAEQGREVRPKLPFGWLFLRTTRLPFLTATFVPILLGIAVAAWTNGFNWWLALLTLIGGACIHLGLNVANDVFDTTSGADAANVNPTQFSGGSRVVLYGLLSLRELALLSLGFYAADLDTLDGRLADHHCFAADERRAGGDVGIPVGHSLQFAPVRDLTVH